MPGNYLAEPTWFIARNNRVVPSGTYAEYTAWKCMKQRCHNPSNRDWKYYGGRGISVWWPWRQDFLAFYMYVGPRPSPKHSLDRIDNDGGYVPTNVRWATPVEQRTNRRPNHSA